MRTPTNHLPRVALLSCAAVLAIVAIAQANHRTITDSDRAFWSFVPVKNPASPKTRDGGWCRNDIDHFILAKLESEGLGPAAQADRATLIRRATFDLIGLPPTPTEVEAFVGDSRPHAYARLIDRLLASPRYGERWGRHWLDLVRYAESDGFKQDSYRPNAWPYRDYVIKSFNDDKPYDRFVTEQLAGDEIAPDDPDVIVATGYLRHTSYEYNQRDVPRQWQDMLDDVTDVTGDAFLGLSMGCAKCHDHKFDPILRSDYYRMQAFFAPMLPRSDLALATKQQQQEYETKLAVWREKTAGIRAQMKPMEQRAIAASSRDAISKFPPEMQAVIAKPAELRTPEEKQWAWLAMRQVYDPSENPQVKVGGKDKENYAALKEQLKGFDAIKPKPLFHGLLATDVGPVAPPTYMPGEKGPRVVLEPGFPVVLNALPAPAIVPTANSTGRRLALAKWIVSPKNPLTARVMVNRIWQYHFGRGLVATSGDFGHLGTPPSHPQLLDYLASRFVEGGWRMKSIHRLIMLSATYRQSALRAMPEVARMKDPENRLLWRMNTRRLEAEQIRDSMLAVSGELKHDAGGPSVDANTPRRSIYMKVIRNSRDPLLDVFDAPESFGSVCVRNQTTTAPQALLMINGDWPLKRAAALAARVRGEEASADAESLVNAVYHLAYGRAPGADELQAAVGFLNRPGKDNEADTPDANLVDFCHVILNSSEFLYVD
ncbi:MAG TPA: DUF1549 and DUF1553 domain-containing protein [Tepidisphaeraceae bacterium]|nr:DUF1549 and DUF1553 domain-containing protein [Tepidisphaeraceae bacterium]